MNWKKVLPIALAVVVVLGAVFGIYCMTRPTKVGIAVHDLSDPATAEYVKLLQNRLIKEGYEVTVTDACNDQSLQNQQIQTFMKEKYAAAVISPVMTSAISETLDIAKQGELPVVLIGKEVSDSALALYDRAVYVGNPAGQWGTLEAEAIMQWQQGGDMNGDGAISYLLVQDDPENVQKQGGVQALLQTLQGEDKVLNEIRQVTTGGSQAESNALCAQRIAEFGKDIEVIVCDSDAGVLGAKQAIRDGGRVVGRDIYLVSTADTQQVLNEIVSGRISAVIHRDFISLSEKITEVLGLLLDKKTPERVNLVDYVTVTQENVVSYIIIE